MQSGVVTKDGPTLEQVLDDERAAKEAAESATEDIDGDEGSDIPADEISDSITEDVEEEVPEEGINEVEEEQTDYESMTVAQLKDLLKRAGKPVSGKKAELIGRLKE